MSPTDNNAELDKFSRMAARWWDPAGEMRPLHDINGARTDYIAARAPVAGKRILDVGCGAGLLAEALAARGARVTGLDLSSEMIAAAKAHAEQSGLTIDYRCIASRELAIALPGAFDVVVCFEMLEHVDSPAYVVDDCAMLCAPGGDLFFSTINRSPKSWVLAIAGAEYVLGLLPRRTHDYAKLIRPGELSRWCRDASLQVAEIIGMRYHPLSRRASFGGAPEVNYFLHARRDDA